MFKVIRKLRVSWILSNFINFWKFLGWRSVKHFHSRISIEVEPGPHVLFTILFSVVQEPRLVHRHTLGQIHFGAAAGQDTPSIQRITYAVHHERFILTILTISLLHSSYNQSGV